jgi:hypothetical protein
MKRVTGLVLFVSVVAFAGFAIANAAEEKKADAKPKPTTLTGEIVDLGCYLGHGAAGEKHKQCAETCIAGGMPMGLLTAKGEVYLLTPPHENKDAYNKAKDWAGDKVELTGLVHERSGLKSIEVASAKPAPAPATTN